MGHDVAPLRLTSHMTIWIGLPHYIKIQKGIWSRTGALELFSLAYKCPNSLVRLIYPISYTPPDPDIAPIYNMVYITPGTYHLVNYLHSKEDTAPQTGEDLNIPSAGLPLKHHKKQEWSLTTDGELYALQASTGSAFAGASTLVEGAGLVFSNNATQFELVPDQQDGWLKIKAPGENLVWQLDNDDKITFGAVHVACCDCEAGNKQRWQLRQWTDALSLVINEPLHHVQQLFSQQAAIVSIKIVV